MSGRDKNQERTEMTSTEVSKARCNRSLLLAVRGVFRLRSAVYRLAANVELAGQKDATDSPTATLRATSTVWFAVSFGLPLLVGAPSLWRVRYLHAGARGSSRAPSPNGNKHLKQQPVAPVTHVTGKSQVLLHEADTGSALAVDGLGTDLHLPSLCQSFDDGVKIAKVSAQAIHAVYDEGLAWADVSECPRQNLGRSVDFARGLVRETSLKINRTRGDEGLRADGLRSGPPTRPCGSR